MFYVKKLFCVTLYITDHMSKMNMMMMMMIIIIIMIMIMYQYYHATIIFISVWLNTVLYLNTVLLLL